jgi:hypothetical protein
LIQKIDPAEARPLLSWIMATLRRTPVSKESRQEKNLQTLLLEKKISLKLMSRQGKQPR